MKEIFINFFNARGNWIAFGFDLSTKKVVLTLMPHKNKEVLLKDAKLLGKYLEKKGLKIRIRDGVKNQDLFGIAEVLMDIYEGTKESDIIDYEYPYKITSFAENVYDEVAKIPRGFVSTYSDIARKAGKPLAVRAVGNILSKNILGLVVPCHRVIKKSGEIGGYGGKKNNNAKKRKILEKEGVKISEKGVVQKESFFK